MTWWKFMKGFLWREYYYSSFLMHLWPLRILNAWWYKNDVTIPFKVTKQMWFLLPLFYHRYYFFYPNILMLLMWIAPYIENTTTLNPTKNLKMTTKPDLRKQKNVNILSNSLFVINLTFYFTIHLDFIFYNKSHDLVETIYQKNVLRYTGFYSCFHQNLLYDQIQRATLMKFS